MKKVGIVSCYFKDNYGSLLQAYATKKILDNNKIFNETISIEYNKDFKKGKKKYYLSQILNFSFIKSKFGMIKIKFHQKINKKLGRNILIRNKKFKEFRKVFNLSKICMNYNELTKLSEEEYCDVIVGSDQLWLPVNVVSNYYTLSWVPDNINKISYATSFGISNIPIKYNSTYKKFLNRINYLSVREESGKKILDSYGIDAKVVCDPTLLLTKEEWEKEFNSVRFIEEKYILCYFLGNNIEHRKFVEKLKEKTGYKIVSINHVDEYVKYSDKFADITPYDVGPREWLNLIKNAEYVCTDSFHGTVFCLIFNKIFFSFRRFNSKNKNNTNSRLDTLLDISGVSKDRILTGLEDVEKVLKYKINYEKVNNNINRVREESKKWLLNSISYNKKNTIDKFIKIKDKKLCCGCAACYSICPKNAIIMTEDEEGFQYPKVDKEKCINCGLCKKVCPILNVKKELKQKQDGYIVSNKNNIILNQSTSGGAFSPIANYIISNGGYVFGAAFDNQFDVNHQCINNKKDLLKFRNSKYVQSNIGNTFKIAKKLLDDGKMVCYSGTPCQIEGLKKFLKKDYNNLILVDVVCRAVPSPGIWKKYKEMLRKKYGEISQIVFRDKKLGYQYSTMMVKFKNGKIIRNGIESDPWLRMFFSGMIIRPSCSNCKFRKKYRESDFTIWDCFNVADLSNKFDEKKGATRILIHTMKGKKIFDKIKDNYHYEQVKVDKLILGLTELKKSPKENLNKKKFYKCYSNNGIELAIKKFFPFSPNIILKKNIRLFLNKIGLDIYVKKLKRLLKRVK